jgi:hypothetical protein
LGEALRVSGQVVSNRCSLGLGSLIVDPFAGSPVKEAIERANGRTGQRHPRSSGRVLAPCGITVIVGLAARQ